MNEQPDSPTLEISLVCISLRNYVVSATDEISKRAGAEIEKVLQGWQTVLGAILEHEEIVDCLRLVAGAIASDLSLIYRALVHLANDGDVVVAHEPEVSAHELAWLLRHLDEHEADLSGGAIAEIASIIMKLTDGTDREFEEPEPSAEDPADDPEKMLSLEEVQAVMDKEPLTQARLLKLMSEVDERVDALEEANAGKRIKYLESARNVPQMLHDQLDVRLAIVEGAIAGRPVAGTPLQPDPDNGSTNWQVPEVESAGEATPDA